MTVISWCVEKLDGTLGAIDYPKTSQHAFYAPSWMVDFFLGCKFLTEQ